MHVRVDEARHDHEIAVVDDRRAVCYIVEIGDAGDASVVDVNGCGAQAGRGEHLLRTNDHRGDANLSRARYAIANRDPRREQNREAAVIERRMRKNIATALLSSVLAVACASTQQAPDQAVLKGLVIANTATQKVAWQQGDASLLAKTLANTSQLPADLQAQVAQTRAVDDLSVDIESVEITGDQATVVAKQRFVRTIEAGGSQQKKTSTATLRHRFRRSGTTWVADAPVEVITANWAGEAPKA